MPIGTPTGYLDITNATLRGSQIVTTGYVGIANANPVNHLSVGSNLHINDTHSNVLQISGNINAAGVVLGGISIAPTFDLEIVTNTGNTTPYTVEFNNTATAFVTTANATIGDTLTASKLVGDGSAISAIQSSNVSDFASNVSRIQTLETANMTIDGEKTFSSNLQVGTANLFVDTTTGNVGISNTNPTHTLNIGSNVIVDDTGVNKLMVTGGIRIITDELVGNSSNLLTDASLYLDGLNGSTATDYSGNGLTVTENGVTWDSAENSWELSGATTSNIVSSDLGFEGDQPHTISAWIKVDQLGYGTPLFHVGTAEGEGDAASRIRFVNDSHISWGGEDHPFSNTEWHNVTYTYNGEGSNKKLYLDGNLVGTAANEDTFGDYPPFAMTGYSQDGYTASASSEYTSDSRLAWKAYDANDNDTSVNAWMTADPSWDNQTPSSPTSASNPGTFTAGGVNYTGHWNKLELPHKLKIDYVYMSGRFSDRVPYKGVFLGSNDDSNWEVIKSFNNTLTWTTVSGVGVTTRVIGITNNNAYKYILLVVEQIVGPNTRLWLNQIQYYGHRENDLVRFPDPTNVLKYPHVDLRPTSNYTNIIDGSAPHAERGYVVTSSTGDAGRLFNGITSYFYSYGLNSGSTTTYTGNANHALSGFARTGYANEVTTEVGGATHTGTWVDLETPRKLKLSQFKVCYGPGSGYAPHSPTNYRVLGRNSTADNWNLLFTIDGSYPNGTTAPSTGGTDKALHTIAVSDQAFYKYHRWVCTRLHSTNSAGTGAIGGGNIARPMIFLGVEYYGTEEDLDVVARIGDGYDGKVRNLRVYSTALSQDLVQDIFNTDSDEFGFVRPSVNVYQGRLGIGTTEPAASLTVMDEYGGGASTLHNGELTLTQKLTVPVIYAGGQQIPTFTGQHRCFPCEPMEQGLIVSADKNQFVKMNKGLATGSKAITIDESLPVVSLSNVAQDKRCFGVVSSLEKPNTVTREELTNGIVSKQKKELGDNRVIVNSVGEGAIWVCDAGGPLESGDYITTSSIKGYGQKQTDDVLHSYTVAKITMDCDFTATLVPVKSIKKAETLVDVTEEVWSNLSDYNRHTVTELKYVNSSGRTLTTVEYMALPASQQGDYTHQNVTTHYRIQRGSNILDAWGNLQWEDTDQVEAPYKIKYLDVLGKETDEANCVHRAAFVGCTYHCG